MRKTGVLATYTQYFAYSYSCSLCISLIDYSRLEHIKLTLFRIGQVHVLNTYGLIEDYKRVKVYGLL